MERVGNSGFEFSTLSTGRHFHRALGTRPSPSGARELPHDCDLIWKRDSHFIPSPSERSDGGYCSLPPRFLRIDSPPISMRWALCTSRSRMLSAKVGSPICSCHLVTGSWLVRTVERA